MTSEQAKAVWPVLVEIGINPVAILHAPMFVDLAREFIEGRMDKAGFQNAVENLNIFSGGKFKGAPPKSIPMTSLN